MSLQRLLPYKNIGTLHSESVLLVIAKVIILRERIRFVDAKFCPDYCVHFHVVLIIVFFTFVCVFVSYPNYIRIFI